MKTIDLRLMINELVNDWNEEFSNYLISENLIKRRFIKHPDTICAKSFVNESNEAIAFLVLKKSLVRDDYCGFISFIYVKKEYRKQGIGKKLIDESIEIFKSLNLKKIFLGSDYGCLFSGLYIDNNESHHLFFKNIGFIKAYKAYNLITENKFTPTKNLKIDNLSYSFEILKDCDRLTFLSFLKNNFSRRWYEENIDTESDDICILKKEGDIKGFVRTCMKTSNNYSNGINNYLRYERVGNTLGSIGPLGVDSTLRGLGLGKELVIYAVNKLFEKGCTRVIVDWTGLVDFYKKCGFEKICDEYIIYSMDI